jgi:eukaryotic-like serine/threonine-protein kinase
MNPDESPAEDWRSIDSLLDSALDLESEARESWLQELARSHPQHAARVRHLLGLAERSDIVEAMSRSGVCEEAMAEVMAAGEGARFGSWIVGRPLGIGGMSEVVLARRELESGVQLAALKLLSVGMSGNEALTRFIREAAILSQLNDVRIARLIDSGRASDGRPWLAMEYVDGDPIDIGCDRLGLSIRERVRRLIEVAKAVDHAHRQLIVHRDIKPGNVMLCNEGAEIRLLDFGIAKMLDPASVEDTNAHTHAFTLKFASPEQLAGRSVSTASDIHQLGSLLYLLLTGRRPFQGCEETPAAALLAMQEGASKPSRAVFADGIDQRARCGMSAAKLRNFLHGDLDTIVMKAMEFEPQRRYVGARELAEDLERWMRGDAIAARPDPMYRARKFIRKHRISLAAVALSFVLVVAYALSLIQQRQQLRMERDTARKALARAEATRQFLYRVIDKENPNGERTGAGSIESSLERAASNIESEFRGQPELAAETYVELGQAFDGRGDSDKAEKAFRRSLEISSAQGDPTPNATAISGLGLALVTLDRADEAKQLIEREIGRVLAYFGEQSDEHIGMLMALARAESALAASGDPDSRAKREGYVRSLLERALQDHNALYPIHSDAPQPVAAEGVRSDLQASIGNSYLRAGDVHRALPYLRAHYEQQLAIDGANAARTLSAQMNLANALQKLERYDESRALLANMVDDLRRQYGRGAHRMVAFALGALGNQSRLTGHFAEAAKYWAEAEQEARGAMGEDSPWLGSAQYRQAEALALGGNGQDAVAILEKILTSSSENKALLERTTELLNKLRSEPHAD